MVFSRKKNLKRNYFGIHTLAPDDQSLSLLSVSLLPVSLLQVVGEGERDEQEGDHEEHAAGQHAGGLGHLRGRGPVPERTISIGGCNRGKLQLGFTFCARRLENGDII